VEVEVDIDTGQVHVVNITFSHDCGRVIHPQIVEGQVIGGIIHGIGNALFEQMSYDENAQPLSMTLAEYLLVTSTETPTRIKLLHQESPTPLNELGVKEPKIQQMGPKGILIELPGIQDTTRAKDLISAVATLQFHLVATTGSSTRNTRASTLTPCPSASATSIWGIRSRIASAPISSRRGNSSAETRGASTWQSRMSAT
jgi:hypothetical protein